MNKVNIPLNTLLRYLVSGSGLVSTHLHAVNDTHGACIFSLTFPSLIHSSIHPIVILRNRSQQS